MEKLTAGSGTQERFDLSQLVDFDMLYGHRKDVEALPSRWKSSNRLLTSFCVLSRSDLLMITADHGCDPDPRWATTDHRANMCPF